MKKGRKTVMSIVSTLTFGLLFFSLNLTYSQEKQSAPEINFDLLQKVKEIFTATQEYIETIDSNGNIDIQYKIKQIPDIIKKNIDKEVSITGYIIAGGKTANKNYQYLLAKHTWDWCCQGVPPTLFTSLVINTDKPLESSRITKITLKGKFNLQVTEDESKNIIGLFTLSDVCTQKGLSKIKPKHIILLIIFALFCSIILSMFLIKFIQTKKNAQLTSKNTSKASLIVNKNLKIGYTKNIILSDINLNIDKGNLLGIIGPNGSGKTTLIRTLMGIIPPLGGISQRKKNLTFGYVMQRQTLDTLYPFSVFELAMMGRYGLIPPPYRVRKKDITKVEEALKLTDIWNLRYTPLRELSGGQKQRALIARALSSEPEVIILDEPTNDMDLKGEEAVISLIKKIHSETKAAVIIVSHLLPVVLNIADNILFLQGKNNYKIYKREELVKNNYLEKIYQVPVEIIKENNRYSIIMRGKA